MELQDQEHGGKLINRQTGLLSEFVDINRVEAQVFAQFTIVIINCVQHMFSQRPELSDDICGGFYELGSLSNQFVTATGQWIMDGSGQGEHLASLFGGESRRYQRTAAAGGLNDQGAEAKATYQAISFGEVPSLGRRAERIFAHERAAIDDRVGQLAIASRVNAVNAIADKRDGLATRVERALMRSSVDALRKSACYAKAVAGEVSCEIARVAHAAFGRVTTSDNRKRRQVQGLDIAIDVQHERWPLYLGEYFRVTVVAPRD